MDKKERKEINFSRSQMGEELGDFNAPIHLQSIGIQSVEQIERKGMSSNEMVLIHTACFKVMKFPIFFSR